MYRRRRCSSLPVLSRLRFRPGPRHPLAATVAATALSLGVALAACSSGDDPETGSDQTRSTTGDDSSVGPSSDPDVVLTFGDPGEVEGFEPVTDVEVDPVDNDELEPPVLPTPDAVVPTIAERMEPAADGQDLLDTVEVVDEVEGAATERDGRTRNEAGEPATLDEAANLACAQTELAIDQIDGGYAEVASERIIAAADRAGSSELADIRAWSPTLAAVVAAGSGADLAPLVGFLTVCTEGGYEL